MIISIIAIIALSVFLFSMDLSWSNVISSQRNDLVFEGRNTSYGAYSLRKEHHVNLFYALLLALGVIGGGMYGIGKWNGTPTPKPNPSEFSYMIPVDIRPIERAKVEEEKKPETERKEQKASGQENKEVEVTQNAIVKPILSDLERHDKQQGGGGEDPTGIVEPYDPGAGSGGGDGSEVVVKKTARRYVKNPPQFPGGVDEMMQYMKPRVRYSDMDIEKNVEGIIYISFVVNEDGSIGDIMIERGIRNGDRLAKKAIEAINAMPRWTPGDDGKEPLPVIVTMPLHFELHN